MGLLPAGLWSHGQGPMRGQVAQEGSAFSRLPDGLDSAEFLEPE